MKILFFLTILLTLVINSTEAIKVVPDPSSNYFDLPRYQIDLNHPPEVRWKQVIANYKAQSHHLEEYFDQLTKALPREMVILLEEIVEKFIPATQIPEELKLEMLSFSKGFNVPLGMVVILNYIYELRYFGPATNVTQQTGACTSIVVQDVKGVIWHGRNLDWNLPRNLRNMFFRCDFVRADRQLYSGVCFPGYVGQITSFNPKAGFAVSINERHLGGTPWANLYYSVFTPSWAPSHLLRQVMETKSNFSSAVSSLELSTLSAPVYFIVSGNSSEAREKSQGVVISRERTTVHSSRWFAGDWFVLETNYDWDVEPPTRDNRRVYALKYLKEMGQRNVTFINLQNIMNRWPVRNNNTAYTTMISTGQGVFQTQIQ